MEIEELEVIHNGKKPKTTRSAFPVAYELELKRIIEHAAYLRAEQDGFKQSPIDYWLAAEKEVHRYF